MARGMAAYISESNRSENVVWVGSTGHVMHSVLPKGGRWTTELVARDSHPKTDVAAISFQLQNTEHILYVDQNANLIDLLRDTPSGTGVGGWHRNVSYVDQNLLLEPLSPLTAWIAPDDTEHWVYAKLGADAVPWWTEFFYTNGAGSQTVNGLAGVTGGSSLVALWDSIHP